MKVLVYDPYVDEKTISSYGGEKISNLEDGLKKLDILSLSVPLTKETKNMIQENRGGSIKIKRINNKETFITNKLYYEI